LGLTATALGGSVLHVWYLGRLVHDPAMSVVFALFAAALIGVGWWRWAWRPRDPATGFRVAGVRARSPTVSSIFLEPARARHRLGEPALPHLAGQFAWLRLSQAPKAGEHPFTIASASGARRVELVIRHRGDFTRAMRALPTGHRVWLDGPHGAFTVEDAMARIGLICSGVGIAPMLSILRTAAEQGDRRPYALIQYAGRPDDVLFREELKDLAERLDLELFEVVAPDPLDPVIANVPDIERWHWFVCGPPPMVRATETALTAAGVPLGRINTELFD
jgi:3-phenylpropionate/trans-cinnamate dioxygenase ferredoxin reductase subunit